MDAIVSTSVRLPADVHAAYKRSGISLPDLVRRGLANAPARPSSTGAELLSRISEVERLLAGLLELVGRLEVPAVSVPHMSAEDHERKAAEWYRERVAIWHRALMRGTVPDADGRRFVTARAAMMAGEWSSTTTARERLTLLCHQGLARLSSSADRPGQSHVWEVFAEAQPVNEVGEW